MSYLGGIYQSSFELIIHWSVELTKMTIEAQLYNLLAEFIYGNVRFTVELADEFVRRGLHDGWPADCWPYLLRVMIVRDLLRLAMEILGDLPMLGTSGTVALVWRCREEP